MDKFFAILRSPSEEGHTSVARRILRSAAVVEPYERFGEARPAGDRGLWVLVSQRSLCIAEPKAASCAPKKVAIKEGVLLATFRPPTKRFPKPGDFLLQGLVPDDVRRAVVIIGKHRRLVVDVKRNVFSVERDQPVHLKRLLRGD